MKQILFITFLTFLSQKTLAELTIVEVRRNIPLADSDPVYKDFYIAGDSIVSLKDNSTVTAYRSWSLRDSSGSQTIGEIVTPVAQLKIIAISGKIAIAREVKLISRDSEAMLEQISPMIGDQIK